MEFKKIRDEFYQIWENGNLIGHISKLVPDGEWLYANTPEQQLRQIAEFMADLEGGC